MNRKATTIALIAALSATALGAELTTNGDFETGDTSGWESFPTPTSTFNITSDANSGLFAAEINNLHPTSAAVVKQANLGIGLVSPGDMIEISFAAKGEGMIGGVAFAEFFSEVDGGGTSSAVILGGGPLPLTSTYQTFTFNVLAGPDVDAGVTLQFAVVTGANVGSTSLLFIDDVTVNDTSVGCGAGCDVSGGDADVDDDCSVTLSDLAAVLANFGTTAGAAHADGDTDLDGDIDLTDLANVLAAFGAACP